MRVRITRYAARLLDLDNFAGGCKPLIDAMRKRGLIVDDDPASVSLEFAQAKCSRADERTELEVMA